MHARAQLHLESSSSKSKHERIRKSEGSVISPALILTITWTLICFDLCCYNSLHAFQSSPRRVHFCNLFTGTCSLLNYFILLFWQSPAAVMLARRLIQRSSTAGRPLSRSLSGDVRHGILGSVGRLGFY